METEDVIIVGGAPAGLSAAIYTARAYLKPLVIAGSPPGGQLTLTSDVENYPGFESILGPELIEKMRLHARKFETRFVDDNVTSVDFSTRPLKLTTSTQQNYSARSVIITTGASALWLGLANETRLRGRGVSACATCDGFFFKGKVVAVVGGGDTAMEEAITLSKLATKVYLIHRRDSFRASQIMQKRVMENPKIEIIWNTVIEDVLGKEKVEGLITKDVSTGKTTENLLIDGLFLAIGHKPNTDFLKDSGVDLDKKGYILTFNRLAEDYLRGSIEITEEKMAKIKKTTNLYSSHTSVQGVFAAGDCVDHVYRQAGTAVGMGIAAALDVERYLAAQ